MFRDADTALNRAKAEGRSGYKVFDHTMREQAVERLQLETDLRQAIDRGEFLVHYQPIVSLATGTVTGVEALLRWQHPERGMVNAADFIPLAEETGLIVPMGLWAFEDVCRQLQQWMGLDPPAPSITVSVNVSARQLPQADLPQCLAEIARRYGVPTTMIELEITESAVMADFDQARTAIERLRDLGFRISIDDFGTGYSSLAYLQRLPVDRLKLDRSFIAGASGASGSSDGIIRAVIGLARHLNADVVAEGVETLDQLQRLRNVQCNCAQGFYFLRPVCPEPLSRLLLADGRPLSTESPSGAETESAEFQRDTPSTA